MTRVRLEYFPDPGPAATAVRAKGMPYEGQLIQIEGVAVKGDSRKNRQRIMPVESWDWSIAVPLSQGWKIGNRIFVGGQISADEKGMPVHVGDLDAQTRNIYSYIGRVLSDAGGSFKDLVRVKICFKYDSKDPQTGKAFAERIMDISKEYIDGNAPVISAFAVDLLYPGLDVEIDAIAIIDPDKQILSPSELGGRYQPAEFSDGINADGEIYVAGQTALQQDGSVMSPDDISEQTREVFHRISNVLAETDATLTDEVKLWLNKDRIRLFKKPFFLVNTARGKVVKTTDLIEALESGKIRGACLDVLENERFDRYSDQDWAWFYALKKQKNIILTPHVAGWTVESKERLARVLVDKIRAYYY